MAAPISPFEACTAAMISSRSKASTLGGYLEKLFPMMPGWTYRADELWPIAGGFCARWYCEMEGGRSLRGFDFVQMKQGLIARNEVYTHQI